MDTFFYIKLVIDLIIISLLIYAWFKINRLDRLVKAQHLIIQTQDVLLQLWEQDAKQEKCYGSTSDSKPESQGSTPCSCEAIIKELEK